LLNKKYRIPNKKAPRFTLRLLVQLVLFLKKSANSIIKELEDIYELLE
jgi:hypothetical protein